MTDLVKRAKYFATQAHQRIGHRRKYTRQPYEVHLKAVAQAVASVTDDEEMIAAAWLHDTVEDTAATHRDIEENFGKAVRRLVFELTDVSRPGDGNRAERKAIDREHIARASPRAKTIKLADLIDNLRDICKHDERFSRVYLHEMAALLEVLKEGDPALLKRARRELGRCAVKLGLDQPPGTMLAIEEPPRFEAADYSQRRVQRLFSEAFTAKDIAEPLHSFDADRPAQKVAGEMEALGAVVAGVRRDGLVTGYVWKSDLTRGTCGNRARLFGRDQVVYGDASLSDVILVLTRYDNCFISLLGHPGGVVDRSDIEKPIVRMWLFGMITMIEMNMTTRIRERWPGGTWKELLSAARLKRAEALLEERKRRGQHGSLLDCLQLSDKARIFFAEPRHMEELGLKSKSEADRVIREFESLRNNLAHGQSIVTYDWPQIVRMTQEIESIIRSGI